MVSGDGDDGVDPASGDEEDLDDAAAGGEDAPPPVEADEEQDAESDDEDAAAADAAAGGEGRKPAPARAVAAARHVPLNPQAREGLIRCLQARLAQLDASLAHATEAAGRDSFYSRWPGVVAELRAQALKRLEELQRS